MGGFLPQAAKGGHDIPPRAAVHLDHPRPRPELGGSRPPTVRLRHRRTAPACFRAKVWRLLTAALIHTPSGKRRGDAHRLFAADPLLLHAHASTSAGAPSASFCSSPVPPSSPTAWRRWAFLVLKTDPAWFGGMILGDACVVAWAIVARDQKAMFWFIIPMKTDGHGLRDDRLGTSYRSSPSAWGLKVSSRHSPRWAPATSSARHPPSAATGSSSSSSACRTRSTTSPARRRRSAPASHLRVIPGGAKDDDDDRILH